MKTNLVSPDFTILGAGLTGSLLASFVAQKGYSVHVYEKRPDPRSSASSHGRSINLALSHRGIQALKAAKIYDKVKNLSIPMKGRMIHVPGEPLHFQPYGDDGQFIYSISRAALNKTLIEAAANDGALIFFESAVSGVDFNDKSFTCSSTQRGEITVAYQFLFGTDGAYSALRQSRMQLPQFNYTQHYIEYGYKELSIPANDGKHVMAPNALHIWPREDFMLIALPNLDGSFTCTLFLPFEGKNSFKSLNTIHDVRSFFSIHFADAVPLMDDLEGEFFTNPTSSMITISCDPWEYKDTLLLGDAAHAIVPFYGQGMNAGFEDIRMLMGEWEKDKDLATILSAFTAQRRQNTDAISRLALQNFVEMRDLVADEDFQLRKKIEQKLHQTFPDYNSLYSLVTFSDVPYSQALQISKKQNEMFGNILALPDIYQSWQDEKVWQEIKKIYDQFFDPSFRST